VGSTHAGLDHSLRHSASVRPPFLAAWADNARGALTRLRAAAMLHVSLPRARRHTVILLASVSLALAAGCARARLRETADTAERAVLERRRQGLEGLMAAARRGALLPFDQVLVIADEGLVRQVLTATLPFERVIAERYRVRVTRAEVHFEDGFGLVRLDGEASFADRPESEGRAVLTVYGGLDVVDLDPESGLLRGEIKIIAVDARRVNVLGMQSRMVENLVEGLGRERLEAFSALASRIEIPVQLERRVALPAVGSGEVHIEAATIPLRVAVADVKAFRGKLWVSVDVSVEPGAEEAASPSGATGVRP
jgi:hypothetical protein